MQRLLRKNSKMASYFQLTSPVIWKCLRLYQNDIKSLSQDPDIECHLNRAILQNCNSILILRDGVTGIVRILSAPRRVEATMWFTKRMAAAKYKHSIILNFIHILNQHSKRSNSSHICTTYYVVCPATLHVIKYFWAVAASQHTDPWSTNVINSQFCKMTKSTDHLSLRTYFYWLRTLQRCVKKYVYPKWIFEYFLTLARHVCDCWRIKENKPILVAAQRLSYWAE